MSRLLDMTSGKKIPEGFNTIYVYVLGIELYNNLLKANELSYENSHAELSELIELIKFRSYAIFVISEKYINFNLVSEVIALNNFDAEMVEFLSELLSRRFDLTENIILKAINKNWIIYHE